MSWLAECCLTALHLMHVIWTCLIALLYYPFVANPQPLRVHQAKAPANVALVLCSIGEKPSEEEKDVAVRSIVSAVRWCKDAGVKGLSVYDRHGFVTKHSEQIKTLLRYDAPHIPSESGCSSDASDSEYPPTPPLTDYTDSRPISPESWCSPPPVITIDVDSTSLNAQPSSLKRRHIATKSQRSRQQNKKRTIITLSLVSYEASKPLLASIAREFTAYGMTLKKLGDGEAVEPEISVEMVEKAVQGSSFFETGKLHLQPPDLAIVHSIEQHSLAAPPLELHGFPPWLIRLTEVYYDERPSLSRSWQNRGNKRNFVALSEENFRRALDSYAAAEMRLGK